MPKTSLNYWFISVISHKNICKIIILLSLIFAGYDTYAQSVSNAGREFWSVFPTHEPDNSSLANLSVFITGDQASSGTITVGTYSTTFAVAANAVLEVPIPRNAAYINDTEGGRVLSNRAIHIVVDPGKPKVVVYTHIFAGNRSAASLILPKEALGQQYYSMSYTQDDAGQNYITIVATEPNTKVHLRKGATELVPGGITLPNVNDVYEYLSATDLTGVSVSVDTLASGCNSFALFSGSSGVRIGAGSCTPGSIDPLFQQCYPITSWGKNYGFIPFSTKSATFGTPVRTAGQYARVLAREDGTLVTINGTVVATLNHGEFYTTPQPLTTTSYISGSKPVSVAQYALSQSCSNTNGSNNSYSDPDMVILNPIEYNINNISIYSSTKEHITEQYINILMRTIAAPSFRINNAVPSLPFTAMPDLPGYSYLQLPLNGLGTNTFNLSASEGFNAIAYGFGNVESYSYSAGTNLAANESISAVLANSQTRIDSTCINNNYFFKLTLPYQPPQINWQMDANETPTIQTNPVGTPVTVQGFTYYEYSFPKTAAYNTAGKHLIKILAQYPLTIGGCSKSQEQINYSFTVIPVPVVNFTAVPEKCHNVIDFTDLTTTNSVNGISTRTWNFGDGQTSVLQNPIHTYADTGRYIVSLTTTFTTGCQDTKLDTIKIRQKVYPGFTASAPDCVDHAVTFTDTTKTTDFIIATRKWIFGDGDSLIVNNNAPFQHVFKTAGTYTIKLTLTNTEGCVNIPYTKTIAIHNNPVPDFKLPTVCLTDQLAQFTDQTTIPDSTEKPFTYLWTFGDPNATVANPNTSTLKNPSHTYTAALNYTVTLTVTTPQGCTNTISKLFTVNGANPVASFKVISNKVCANNEVVFQNTSSVDFGSITKLEWHFDNTANPNTSETTLNPTLGQLFTHQYPVFHAPVSKTYTVRLLAYSGTQCVTDTFKTITVQAAPQTILDSLNNVCLPMTPFKITQGHETSGLPGIAVYSGDGMSADGTFDPAAAGAGTHIIKYKFTSTLGCADSASRTITVTNTVASFKILNSKTCSNDPIIFQNASSAAPGPLVKLEWHFDNSANPNISETVMNPTPGQLFTHQYPMFHTPASKTYTIRLVAYSGTQCVADTFKTITIQATPQTTLDSLNKVCLSATPFKFTQGHETSGLAGTTVYSGDGTSADDTFNPVTAGVGTHTIKYKFTSTSGCADSASRQITVVADPAVDAGPDLRIDQGDHITLAPKITGTGLTYKWTPATGLDHDDISQPKASPDKDITYTLTVSNGTCLAFDDVHVMVVPPLMIPNTFTPNGDGIHDVWNIKGLNFYYPNALIEVYTKHGLKVFSSVGYGIPWDGSYNGHIMPPDTYYYIIDLQNGQKKLASWLQLLR